MLREDSLISLQIVGSRAADGVNICVCTMLTMSGGYWDPAVFASRPEPALLTSSRAEGGGSGFFFLVFLHLYPWSALIIQSIDFTMHPSIDRRVLLLPQETADSTFSSQTNIPSGDSAQRTL